MGRVKSAAGQVAWHWLRLLSLLCLFIGAVPVWAGSALYEYDAVGRLKSASYDDASALRYELDASGNRLSESVVRSVSASITQSAPTTVAGTSYTLTWASSGATSCTVDYSRNGEPWVFYSAALSGTLTIAPVVVGTHVWRNRCTNATGASAESTFTHQVTAAANATLTQSTSFTVAGTSYTITWGSTNAVSCTVEYSRNGEPWVFYSAALSGTLTIAPVVVGTHVWRNRCTGAGGDVATASFTHTVYAKVSATMTQSSTSSPVGVAYSVSWTASNAVSCTVDRSLDGAPWVFITSALSSTVSATPTAKGNYVWRIRCSGANGDAYETGLGHLVN